MVVTLITPTLSEELKRYKKEKGLKDFTDLLEDFITQTTKQNL